MCFLSNFCFIFRLSNPIATDGEEEYIFLQNTLINSQVSKLQDIKSANKIKKTLSKRYEKRKGGYTRIVKAGFRYGDNAPMAIIELVDRDVEAKRVDRKKIDTAKENKEEKKLPTV